MLMVPVSASTAILGLVSLGQAQWDASRFAWYKSDAGTDFQSALPIGNGRVAAAVYGTIAEQLALNENSIWSGPWQDRANPNSLGALAEIRSQLISGNITGAGQNVLANMSGIPISPRQYQPLGNLTIDFGHSANVTDYFRYLDTYRGTAFVSYVYGGVNYTREYVASYPYGVLAVRLSADQAGALDANISLFRTQNMTSQTASSSNGIHSVFLGGDSGQAVDPIAFSSAARVVNSGGSVSVSGSSIAVAGASTVDIFFDAETSYRYAGQSEWEAELARKLDAAVAAGYDVVRSAAIEDTTALIGRVKLDLGSSSSAGTEDTGTRLENYRENLDADPQLPVLMFNFGRHSLVASSRDTGPLSIPANLQGIWNKDFEPAWGSKYTVSSTSYDYLLFANFININIQMNYWPAEVTNLAETSKPLFDLLQVALPRGQEMAKAMYGCDNGGFVLHHNIDIWGDAAPTDYGTPWMMWPMGGAWLVQHLLEHYRFTQDLHFLSTTAWPLLAASSRFYQCYAFASPSSEGGYLETGPSLSPENSFVVPAGWAAAGQGESVDLSPQLDRSLLGAVWGGVVEACDIIITTATGEEEEEEECARARELLPRVRPPQTGSYGQVLEWRREYAEAEPGHRHMSPLWDLFPGSAFAPASSSALAAAARALLDHRMDAGSGSTGWSRAWAAALYARLGDGPAAWEQAVTFVRTFPGANLWNTDSGPGSAFQIDGNLGFVAAVAEMLVQSHAGVVHLLPALPVPAGSVAGLVARGGFVVEGMRWEGGLLVEADVVSRNRGTLALRVQDGLAFEVDGEVYEGPILTEAGGIYHIRPVAS
ncbi:Six-hairpin glycosidase-like protein [Biscogniauxia mediterranea]|nr:Six-hairpin glycosidase-like protein [Biscogniauxia mediterranea]